MAIMTPLNYSLMTLISFFGIIAGIVLAIIAKEELKDGKRYFKMIISVCFGVISLNVLRSLNIITLFAIIISIIIIATIQLSNFSEKTEYLYALAGILLFIIYNSRQEELFTIASTALFLLGLATAGIKFDVKTKNYKEIILKHLSFLIISFILLAVF